MTVSSTAVDSAAYRLPGGISDHSRNRIPSIPLHGLFLVPVKAERKITIKEKIHYSKKKKDRNLYLEIHGNKSHIIIEKTVVNCFVSLLLSLLGTSGSQFCICMISILQIRREIDRVQIKYFPNQDSWLFN